MMTDDDIKKTIQTIEVHHEHGWWVAVIPDINVATQARTLPELGVEVERIICAHFALHTEYGGDPFRLKRPSMREIATRALDGWSRLVGSSTTSSPARDDADTQAIEALRKDLRDGR